MKIRIKGEHPQEWYDRRNDALGEYLLGESTKMERWAKENAPWEDQTGNARRFLMAGYDRNEKGHTVWVGQGVEYGKWLETARDKAYAICLPTIKHFVPIINVAVGKTFNEK
jgi:hypothetical protein